MNHVLSGLEPASPRPSITVSVLAFITYLLGAQPYYSPTPVSMSLLKMHLPPFDNGVYPLATMTLGNPLSFLPSPQAAPSPDFVNTQELLRTILRAPRLHLHQVERLGGQVHRLYLVRSTDGRAYVLKCPPSHNVHLFRHEQRSLHGESQILKLIASAPEIPVPQSIHCREHGGAFGPYLLRTYIQGTRLSQISPYLSTSQRAHIDRSLGYFLKRITSSTAGTYGLSGPVFAGEGQSTWREAFHHLLESTLRDAEDMLVSIPYQSIRSHFQKQEALFDQVTTSQLVPMQAGLPSNVLINDLTKQVSGLIGFSDVLWGDPMISPILANASPEFWEGFGSCPLRTGNERVRQLL